MISRWVHLLLLVIVFEVPSNMCNFFKPSFSLSDMHKREIVEQLILELTNFTRYFEIQFPSLINRLRRASYEYLRYFIKPDEIGQLINTTRRPLQLLSAVNFLQKVNLYITLEGEPERPVELTVLIEYNGRIKDVAHVYGTPSLNEGIISQYTHGIHDIHPIALAPMVFKKLIFRHLNLINLHYEIGYIFVREYTSVLSLLKNTLMITDWNHKLKDVNLIPWCQRTHESSHLIAQYLKLRELPPPPLEIHCPKAYHNNYSYSYTQTYVTNLAQLSAMAAGYSCSL